MKLNGKDCQKCHAIKKYYAVNKGEMRVKPDNKEQ